MRRCGERLKKLTEHYQAIKRRYSERQLGGAVITNCDECKAKIAKDAIGGEDQSPPCSGGKPCPFNLVELTPQNKKAVNLFSQGEALGWDLVLALKPLQLFPYEGELLLDKFMIIKNAMYTIAEMKANNKG